MNPAPLITIAVPVGPDFHHCLYLDECLKSIEAQTVRDFEVLFVSDMHSDACITRHAEARLTVPWRIHDNYWRLGVAASFNIGVGLSVAPWTLMMGADDMLMPDCLETFLERSTSTPVPEIYYWWLPLQYLDDLTEQYVPCNAAFVHFTMWRASGGFPPEVGSGAPDAAWISRVLASNPDMLRAVDNRPLYQYRRHADSDTARRGRWQGVILETRNLLTDEWEKPGNWTRGMDH